MAEALQSDASMLLIIHEADGGVLTRSNVAIPEAVVLAELGKMMLMSNAFGVTNEPTEAE